jgi:hypothetical protein
MKSIRNYLCYNLLTTCWKTEGDQQQVLVLRLGHAYLQQKKGTFSYNTAFHHTHSSD